MFEHINVLIHLKIVFSSFFFRMFGQFHIFAFKIRFPGKHNDESMHLPILEACSLNRSNKQ